MIFLKRHTKIGIRNESVIHSVIGIDNGIFVRWCKRMIEVKDVYVDGYGTVKEAVNHPSHYNIEGRKECIDEMIDIWGAENTALWCEMTAYKYQYRKGEKDGNPINQELVKIQWYLSKAAELRGLKNERSN